MKLLTSFLNDLLDFAIPQICVCCKEPLVRGETKGCLKCLFLLSPSRKPHGCFDYREDGHVKAIVLQFKFRQNRSLAYLAGKLMAHRLMQTDLFKGVDCLIPVPLSALKKCKRGYNQAYWIALGIQELTGIPVETSVLHRHFEMPWERSQASRSPQERRKKNVNKFYAKNTHLIENKCVLIVDDVITSGATLDNCRNILKGISGVVIKIVAFSSA